MVHDELGAGVEVCPVEFVWNIPAERTKLPPLLNHGVEEGHRVQHVRPGGVVGVVQRILGYISIGSLQAGSDTLRRFVGELEGHLEETDREVFIHLCGQPEPDPGPWLEIGNPEPGSWRELRSVRMDRIRWRGDKSREPCCRIRPALILDPGLSSQENLLRGSRKYISEPRNNLL